MKNLIFRLMLLVCLFVAVPAHAASDARIDEVAMGSDNQFSVSFVVKNAFTKEIEEAIRSGVPTSFKFIVKLSRVNSLWFNDEVASREFRHTVKYDTLKEEYEVTLDEVPAPFRTKDFSEMKKAMATGSAVPLEAKVAFVNGAVYELRLMAELRTVKLPFLLDYMLFFVKYWDFETDWYTLRFTR